MLEHGVSDLPFEACGLLSGTATTIKRVWKAVNKQRKRDAFEIDEKEVSEIFRKLEDEKEVFQGIYHSHPTAPAVPSKEDIHHAYQDKPYLIVSFAKKKPIIKCFIIRNGKAIPVKIKLID